MEDLQMPSKDMTIYTAMMSSLTNALGLLGEFSPVPMIPTVHSSTFTKSNLYLDLLYGSSPTTSPHALMPS